KNKDTIESEIISCSFFAKLNNETYTKVFASAVDTSYKHLRYIDTKRLTNKEAYSQFCLKAIHEQEYGYRTFEDLLINELDKNSYVAICLASFEYNGDYLEKFNINKLIVNGEVDKTAYLSICTTAVKQYGNALRSVNTEYI